MKKKKKKKRIIKFIIETIIIVVVVTVAFNKVIKPIRVEGESMYPTLNNGDFAMINSLFLNKDEIKRFDVVVLKCKILDKKIIKRIIGLPGDEIVFKNDRLYINGTYYDESYLDQNYVAASKEKYRTAVFTNNFEIKLGKDEIFVMGDNRLKSSDSRALGTFSYDDIIGKRGLILYPLKNMNFID